MDALTEVLNAVRMRSTVHCPTEALGSWGLSIGRKEAAKFCVVLSGHCWIEAEGLKPMRLNAGDFAVLTRSLPHTVRTSLSSPLVSLETVLAEHPKDPDGILRCGSDGEKTVLIGGSFVFDDFLTNPLLRALPAILYVSEEQGRAVGMETTIRLAMNEALSGRPGSETVLTRLSDILFIQAVRAYLMHLPESDTNWIRGALDPQIGGTITAIHQNPGYDWQVATLAAHAAMSRSAFADRFSRLVGEPPLRYVTRWRIHKAARLLSENRDSVARVAAVSGYQSEAAFSKVFKQWTGQTPSSFRRAEKASG
jgi:AraC-like DNA-binding protein